jgi:hypothetical protein
MMKPVGISMAKLDQCEEDTLKLMEIAEKSVELLEQMPCDVEALARLSKSFANKIEGLRSDLLEQSSHLVPLTGSAGTVDYAKQEKSS